MSPLFEGLKGESSGDFYRGSPCIHKKHSGTSGSAKSWRDSGTHQCMECISDIDAGYLTFDLDSLQQKYRNTAIRFWSNVEISNLDECWRWTGGLSKNRHLFFCWKRDEISSTYRYHPIHVLNWITRGDIGKMPTITTCGQRRCCNPLHQLPLGCDITKHDRDRLEEELKQLKFRIEDFYRPEFDQDRPYDIPTYESEYTYMNALRQLSVRQL